MYRKIITSLFTSLGIAAFLSLLFWQGFLAGWQNRFSDALFQPRPISKDILLIAIDDKSIAQIGRWPWDRTVHAQLLEKLGTKPAVIGFDVMFSEASTQQADSALVQAVQKSSPVVFPKEAVRLTSQGGADEILSPLAQFTASASAGIVNLITGTDGITRKIPLTVPDANGQRQPTFSCLILEAYQGKNANPTFGNTLEHYCVLPHSPILINYVGKPRSYPMYSYSDIINGTVDPEVFVNKIVLIGATAPDLHDDVQTPVSNGKPMNGIEVHANVLQMLLDQKFLTDETPRTTVITILLIAFAGALLVFLLPLWPATTVAFAAILAYIFYVSASFDRGVIRNIIYPILLILLIYIFQLAWKYFTEYRQRRFLRRAFSYYLSESVLETIVADPKRLKLGGERKELTVLFSDIAGFTSISEKLDPELLTQLLNQYLTQMTNLVFKYNGVLDKYIGDAVMAFWGAPLPDADHALHACKTALEMQEAIEGLKDEWGKHNVGDFSVRIGINTGDMAVGNMGSETRFDYTLIGDNVNLGSRLEGINKEYDTRIMISESTYEQVKDHVVARLIDTCAVKGKTKGVKIYELRGLGKSPSKEKTFLDAFEQARQLYEKGKFKKALTAFQILSQSHLSDGPIKTYIVRTQTLLADPPTDWDGIFHAKNK